MKAFKGLKLFKFDNFASTEKVSIKKVRFVPEAMQEIFEGHTAASDEFNWETVQNTFYGLFGREGRDQSTWNKFISFLVRVQGQI